MIDNDSFDKSLEPYLIASFGRKAEKIVALDVRGLTSYADAFIICSGRSSRQVSAIGEFIRRQLKKQGIKSLSVDGLNDGNWVLLDYGNIIVHVFYDETREFYDLEGLWIDARRIDTTPFRELAEKETKANDERE